MKKTIVDEFYDLLDCADEKFKDNDEYKIEKAHALGGDLPDGGYILDGDLSEKPINTRMEWLKKIIKKYEVSAK